MVDIRPVTSDADIEVVSELACEIWTQHYVSIIGQGQVDYMVGNFQSAEAISKQISEGYQYFLAYNGDVPVGYLALVPRPDEDSMLLSKIYLRQNARGSGLGRAAIEFAESRCREAGLSKIWLTVNKNNPTISWYERRGFRNVEALVTDIGGGYVMDDYRMEKDV